MCFFQLIFLLVMKTLSSADYIDRINFHRNKVWRILNKLVRNEGPAKDHENVLIHGSCQKLILERFQKKFFFGKPFLNLNLTLKLELT